MCTENFRKVSDILFFLKSYNPPYSTPGPPDSLAGFSVGRREGRRRKGRERGREKKGGKGRRGKGGGWQGRELRKDKEERGEKGGKGGDDLKGLKSHEPEPNRKLTKNAEIRCIASGNIIHF